MRVQAPLAAHPSRRPRTAGVHGGVGPAVPVAPRKAGKPSSAQGVFDAMRESFRKEKAQGVKATYAFDLSGSGGGKWWIVVENGAFAMGTGDAPGKADVTLRASAEDWVKLSNGDLGGTRAFLTGRLKIDGDRGVAKKLDEIFP